MLLDYANKTFNTLMAIAKNAFCHTSGFIAVPMVTMATIHLFSFFLNES